MRQESQFPGEAVTGRSDKLDKSRSAGLGGRFAQARGFLQPRWHCAGNCAGE